MNNTNIAVVVNGLVKKFGDNTAVDGVSFNIQTGSICAVLGPNGAGKTTTINMLATLLKPNAGEAKIFGYDIVKDAQIVRQLVGLTGQFATIDEHLTAMENLTIFAQLLGLPKKEAKKKATELLDEFGLTEAANRQLSKFSGGMRRRLDLAASLISSPPLIFLDEPTTGLDPRTRNQMWQTIRKLVKNGATVLLTTQYLDEADQLADNIIVIDRGRVVANGTPNQLKKSIGSVSLQLTIQDPNLNANAISIVEKIIGAEVQISEISQLTAPMKDADKLPDILEELKKAKISISEISVTKPSLDDVFFALTGDAPKQEEGE